MRPPRRGMSFDGPPGKGSIAAIRPLLPYLWPAGRRDLKIRVVLALAMLVAAKTSTVAVPVLLGMAVDALTPKPELTGSLLITAVPVVLIIAYGAARVMNLAFSELRDALFARVGQHAIRHVSLDVFRHLHALSLRFHLERQTGGLNRAVERGTRAIEQLLFAVLFSVLPTLVEISLVVAILWTSFGFKFAAIVLGIVVVYGFFTFMVTEWRLKFRRQMNESDQQANTKAIDSLLNYETVKYFGNEGHEARRFDEALKSYETAAVKSRTSLSLMNVGQSALIASGVTLIMLVAGQGVVDGELTVGAFVQANTFLIQLTFPLNFLGTVYRDIKQSLVDLDRMFQLLREPAEIKDKPDARPLQLRGGEVRFEKVSFGYDPRRPILKDVSFTVPPGHMLGIVGSTGAGKSTIARLLYRFYDVTGGRILVDGQDLREVTQDSLRGAVGIVPQDTVLFNDTLRYNINYGRVEASEAEMRTAAEQAAIADFIESLPDGWDTVVGERGLKLSGGEKQRVAIARAILKNPAIMIFDEATSALDSATERKVQEAMTNVSRRRTTLVIAHRLSTIIHADEILVLDQGEVAERGRHEELLARGGLYAQLWNRQLKATQQASAAEAAS